MCKVDNQVRRRISSEKLSLYDELTNFSFLVTINVMIVDNEQKR